MGEIQPLWNEKALSIGKSLIIADLHIGYERELEERGVNIPSQTHLMLDSIEDILKVNDYERLIINGDLKHNIPSGSWQEYKEIPKLIDTCLKYINELHLVPGNHDGGIEKYLPSEVYIHDSSGFVADNVGILHGHANPSEDILDKELILLGHSHPCISIIDSLGRKEKMQCWIKTKYHFQDNKGELIILPHYNPMMGGISVNENGYLGPLLNNSELKDEMIYLLDGTYLGTMSNLTDLQRKINPDIK